MTGRTKKLGTIAVVAAVCLASGVVLGHAVTNTAETSVDCLFINPAATGQTACPGPVQASATSHQIFNIAAGALITDCAFVTASLSPQFATQQSTGSFHISTPQFNNTANPVESSKSSGIGASVTYTSTSVTDTTKSFPAAFLGKTIQSKFGTGTVSTISPANTINLTAAWSGIAPVNGDPYQVEPCTDNIGGTTQTVTINGWGINLLDVATDEGSAEGLGSSTCPATLSGTGPFPCDVEDIAVPPDGAIVYESPGQCQIKVNTGVTTKFHVDARYDDNSILNVNGTATGTDNASKIPVTVAAGGGLTCPGGGGLLSTTAYYTGTLSFSVPVRDN